MNQHVPNIMAAVLTHNQHISFPFIISYIYHFQFLVSDHYIHDFTPHYSSVLCHPNSIAFTCS